MAAKVENAYPRTRAALWVSPGRLALAGFAAATISALALSMSSRPENSPGVLKKDVAPVMPVPVERPVEWGHIMRREPKATVLPVPTQERPAEWGAMMRREPKEVLPLAAAGGAVPVGTKRSSGPAMFFAAVFAVLALATFAQQLRSAFALLKDPEALKGKGK
eukprot:gb/GFBE01036438.1/.p1 GENE.gb/GFBE01036438.1/~~gb/GFBE01036438.1/.p1  ORF type:complete len:163 (+),score=40.69 gb/GFBE01036438.1/:1-489(+)